MTVLFENRHGMREEDQFLAPGENFHFEKKIIESGRARVIAPVQLLTACHANGMSTLKPQVNMFGRLKRFDVQDGN